MAHKQIQKSDLIVLRRLAEHANPETTKEQIREVLHERFHEAYFELSEGQINNLVKLIGEWRQYKQSPVNWSSMPELLMLVVCKLSDAMHAFLHLKPDYIKHIEAPSETSEDSMGYMSWPDQIIWQEVFEQEIAGAVTQLFNIADIAGMNMLHAICRKMAITEMDSAKYTNMDNKMNAVYKEEQSNAK